MVSPIFDRDLVLHHVLRAARIVANQEKLVAELRAAGQTTNKAEGALETSKDSLRAFKGVLAAADKEVRTLRVK